MVQTSHQSRTKQSKQSWTGGKFKLPPSPGLDFKIVLDWWEVYTSNQSRTFLSILVLDWQEVYTSTQSRINLISPSQEVYTSNQSRSKQFQTGWKFIFPDQMQQPSSSDISLTTDTLTQPDNINITREFIKISQGRG